MAWTTIAHDCVKKYNEFEHTVTGFAPEYFCGVLVKGDKSKNVYFEISC